MSLFVLPWVFFSSSLRLLVSLAHCVARKYLCPPTHPCLVYLKRAIVPWVHKKIILVFWFLPSCCLASCCVLCAWCLGLGALLWLVFPLFSHGNFMILSVSRVVAQGVCAVDFPQFCEGKLMILSVSRVGAQSFSALDFPQVWDQKFMILCT